MTNGLLFPGSWRVTSQYHGAVRHETLSDGTVWLSAPTEQDVDVIARTCRHSSIGEWTTVPVPYERPDAVNFVAVAVPKGYAEGSPTWALRESDDGEVIGMISLHSHRRDSGESEVGFWLAPHARGRGLMTRAVNVVCNYAFSPHGMRLDRVDWRAFVGNRASASVVRRAGFHYEGLRRGGGVQRGHRRDEWIAGRLSTDPPAPVPWPTEILER